MSPAPGRGAGSGAREYAIVIGAMKSGTTTLFDLLAQHPAIAPSSDKEPGFFALDEVWERGWDWYDGLFDVDPARHRYRLEASTDYTKAPFTDGDVWARMTSRPDVSVRLIYILRDPVRRLESHARHVQLKRKEIGQRLSPRPDHGLDSGLSPVSLAISDYAAQLDAFAAARAAGRLHVLTLEDLKTDPEATLGAVYRFLGLDPLVPEEVAPRNAAADRRRLPPALTSVTSLAPVSAVTRRLLPAALRARLRAGLTRRVRVRGRFAFTPEEHGALTRLLAPSLDRLRREHGVDLRPDRGPEASGGS